MQSQRRDLGRLAGACAAVLAASAAAGCPSSDDESEEETGERDEAAAEPPRVGGHLVLASPEPEHLNPLLEQHFERANALIFEGLIGLDPELEAVPRLAESWELREDGATLEFRLRDDASWHDGEPFTSADVAFTLEALLETDAATVWHTHMAEIETVDTPDEHTVVLDYGEPYAPALKTWTMGIIPEHVYGGEDDVADSPANDEPVGSGPYRLGRWERGERMILRRNDDWWYEDGAGASAESAESAAEGGDDGLPYVERIELKFEVGNQLEALQDNRIDFADIADVASWPQTQFADFREVFEASAVMENEFWAVGWNTGREPLDDPEVRIALTHALDRGRIIDDVLLGRAQALSAPFFPRMFGPDPSIAPHPFDPEEAEAKLDEAGHPERDGERFELELVTPRRPLAHPSHEILAILRHNLSEIGVDLDVVQLSRREFSGRLVLYDYDAVYFGWAPEVPDPDPSILLHSDQIGAGQNMAALADARVDDLLEDARRLTGRDERAEVYRELHALLHEELEPYTMLYAPQSHYAWNRRVRAVNPADAGSSPRFPGLARWFVTTPPRAAPAPGQAPGQAAP